MLQSILQFRNYLVINLYTIFLRGDFIMYYLKNSILNLKRTNGMLTNFIAIFLIAFFTFTSYYLLILFIGWKKTLGYSSADKLAVGVYIVLITILFLTLFIFLILYIKNTFKAFFSMQKEDILTMGFLGGSLKQIGFEFAIQPTICLLLLLPLSSIFAKIIVMKFHSDFLKDVNVTVSTSSEILVNILILIIINLISYFSIYRYIKKILIS